MIKIITLILMIAFIFGCEEVDYTSHRDKTDYDLIDYDTGLKVKFDTPEVFKIFGFTNRWRITQECTGLSSYKGPYIVTVDDSRPEDGRSYVLEGVIEVKASKILASDIINHEINDVLNGDM